MTRQAQGIPVSAGIAIGPCWIYRPYDLKIERRMGAQPQVELERLTNALETARRQLADLSLRAQGVVGKEEAAIFEAHQLFLEDPEFVSAIQAEIQNLQVNAEAAVDSIVESFASQLLALEDEYFRARAQDIYDVGRRIQYCLAGVSPEGQQPGEPVIILAEELTPSDTIQFDRKIIQGLCTRLGGPTSHTAILARSLGVPAAVNVAIDLAAVQAGSTVILNGSSGVLILEPDEEELNAARLAKADWQVEWLALSSAAKQPAQTRDGWRVEVVANIGGIEDARQAVELGAEGVGLLRTEFLYLDAGRLPSEDEQVTVYREIFEVMAGRPVVVRTLDIGGDKPVDYLDLQVEANPFLGWRAIRMAQENPELLLCQFRALLRAAANGTDLRIMLPMVSCLEEVQKAHLLLEQARQSLRARNLPMAARVQFGIMIEVPSAALIAEHLAEVVDFFSIGTNDLTQYTLAVDRTNERVAYLASPFHPAVIQLIARTIEKAHEKGRWVGLCGEMAGDPLAAPLLLGLGLDEFSMAAASIPRLKQIIRSQKMVECQKLAQLTLSQPTSAAVKNALLEAQHGAFFSEQHSDNAE